MSDLLKRGRGDTKTYFKYKKDHDNSDRPQTNDFQLVVGTGEGIKIYPKAQCPKCDTIFLEVSIAYHLTRCNGKTI